MNRKLIYKIALLASLAVSAISCESLDVKPEGFYSQDNFYKTIEDANSALLYAYDGLTYNTYTQTAMYFSEISTDNADIKLDEGANAVQIMNWEVTSENELLLQYYRSLYIAINRANAVIENVLDRGFNQEEANQLMGEAYFLRAYNHFSAVKMFGLAPLQKTLIDKLDEVNAKLPTDMNEVYNFLIDDITKAEELLQIKRNMGRADKVAAQALASKIFLFAASAKESNVPKYDAIAGSVDELYAKAAEYAAKVLFEQTEYGHEPNLIDIYDVEKATGKEHIFSISFDRSGIFEGDYSALSKYYLPYIAGSAVFLKNTDETLSKTHDGWSCIQPRTEIKAAYGDSDKRRTELMVREVYDAEGNVTARTSDGTLAYEFSRKFVDPRFEGDKTSTKPYLLRYSDIQLVYAEATASAEGLIQYNQIRKRADVAELSETDFAAMSKEAYRDLVIEERQRELAFEWDRLWDLRRKNMVQQKVPQAAGLTPEQLAFYPIPQRELDLNPNI